MCLTCSEFCFFCIHPENPVELQDWEFEGMDRFDVARALQMLLCDGVGA